MSCFSHSHEQNLDKINFVHVYLKSYIKNNILTHLQKKEGNSKHFLFLKSLTEHCYHEKIYVEECYTS